MRTNQADRGRAARLKGTADELRIGVDVARRIVGTGHALIVGHRPSGALVYELDEVASRFVLERLGRHVAPRR